MQALRLAVVMDPIADIKYPKDTTLAMLLAARARGLELTYLEQRDLSLRDGVALGRGRPLQVHADPLAWFTLGEARVEPLSGFDVIPHAQGSPFRRRVHLYHLYPRARRGGRGHGGEPPRGLRDINEKVYTAWFPQCCAPTLITRDMADMAAFAAEHGRIVAKPLHGMGGRSIFVVDRTDKNLHVVFETLTNYGTQFAIVQKYLPEIVTGGDSRVLIIDGEPFPYALARIPDATDNRGNLAAGAKGVGRPLEDRDRWLAGQIGPRMAAQGMLFVGLDVIGGFVTEINVTSPTGVRELDKQFGTDIGGTFMDTVLRRLRAGREQR